MRHRTYQSPKANNGHGLAHSAPVLHATAARPHRQSRGFAGHFSFIFPAAAKPLVPRSEFTFKARKMDVDLLHPDPVEEAKKHKLKRLIPNPRSFFMDVKCPGCYSIATVFSHAQTVVLCGR